MTSERVATQAPEEEKTVEIVPLEEVANLLCTLGNDERKGIFLPALRPGMAYSDASIHLLAREIGGKSISGRKINNSLERFIDLGILRHDPETKTYALTKYGWDVAIPFLGFVLSFSERQKNLGLLQIFGASQSTTREQELLTSWGRQIYRKTAQITRIKIYRALSRVEQFPLRETDLALLTGEQKNVVGSHLDSLALHGIVTWVSFGSNEDYTTFRLAPQPKRPPRRFNFVRREVVYRADVVEVLRGRPDESLSVSEIVRLLRQSKSKSKNSKHLQALSDKRLKVILRHTLPQLEKEGHVVRVGFDRKVHSEIKLTKEQAEVIKEIASLVEILQRRDPDILEIGRLLAGEITENRERTAALIAKAKEASYIGSDLARRETKQEILSVVRQFPGSTTRQVGQVLKSQYGNRFTRGGIEDYLSRLKSSGLIEGVKFPGKKAIFWYLVLPNARMTFL